MNYIILIFVPTFLYALEELYGLKSNILEKIAILFLAIFSSLRYEVGVDYSTYMEAYNRMASGIYTDQFDVGYTALSKFLILLGVNFHGLLFIIGLLNGILLYYALKYNVPRHRWLALFFYLSYFDLYVYSLSAIRQSVAVSFFLFSIRFIYEKKPYMYILIILIAASFHWTALFLIPFYFIFNGFLKLDFIKSTILLLITIPIYTFGLNIFELLRPYLSYRLEFYLFIDNSMVESNYRVVLLLILLFIIWQIFIYYFNKKYYLKNKKGINQNDRYIINIPEISISIFLILKIYQNIVYFGALPRLQMYFYALVPFALISVLKRFKPNERVFVAIALIIFFILFFYIKLVENKEFYWIFKLII